MNSQEPTIYAIIADTKTDTAYLNELLQPDPDDPGIIGIKTWLHNLTVSPDELTIFITAENQVFAEMHPEEDLANTGKVIYTAKQGKIEIESRRFFSWVNITPGKDFHGGTGYGFTIGLKETFLSNTYMKKPVKLSSILSGKETKLTPELDSLYKGDETQGAIK